MVNASQLPTSEEGACEPTCVMLRDHTLTCVLRIDGGDGNAGHSASTPDTFKDYVQVFSRDGRTWTDPVTMPNMGCIRPNLVRRKHHFRMPNAKCRMLNANFIGCTSIRLLIAHFPGKT